MKEEILEYFKDINFVYNDCTRFDTLKRMLGELEQQPCDDCISRQAVHDLMATWLSDYLLDETREALEVIDAKVEDLPSVTPESKMGRKLTKTCYKMCDRWKDKPKTGHWKRISMDKYVQHAMAYYRCSECGKDIIGEHRYCPNCGAKME